MISFGNIVMGVNCSRCRIYVGNGWFLMMFKNENWIRNVLILRIVIMV